MKIRVARIAFAMMVAYGAWGQSQLPCPSALKLSTPKQPHATQCNDKSTPDKNSAAVPSISVVVSPAINANPTGAHESQDSDGKSSGKDLIEIIGGLITVIATAVIAIFTVRLSTSTKSLWEETRASGQTAKDAAAAAADLVKASHAQAALMEAQKGLMQSSLETTQKAANAAELSAKAAMGTALANLIPSHMDFGDMGAADFDAKLQAPKIAVQFVNFGKTFAILKSQSLEIVCTSALPEEPRYDNGIRLPFVGLVIDANAGYELADTKRYMFSTDEIAAIKTGSKFLWVYGFLTYEDFLGAHHERRFCDRLYILNPSFRYAFAEDPQIPKAYTESY